MHFTLTRKTAAKVKKTRGILHQFLALLDKFVVHFTKFWTLCETVLF